MFRLVPFALLPLVAAGGCGLDVKSFQGTVIEMDLNDVRPTASGAHLEMWTRDSSNDVIRVDGTYDVTDPNTFATTRYFPYGFVVRPAITMDDPCMIDADGNLLITAAAYKDATLAGVPQTADEQAAAVRARIAQLVVQSDCDGSDPSTWPATTPRGVGPPGGYHCGEQPGMNGNILGLIAYELLDEQGNVMSTAPPPPLTCETSNNAPNCISYHADAATRLAACQSYWRSSLLAYTPNPLQLPAPLHGSLWGVLSYTSVPSVPNYTPGGAFSSIRIDSPVSLKGTQELWLTTEKNDAVDPSHPGPVLMGGKPSDGGNDVIHIELLSPPGAAIPVTGSVALEINLDQAPSQFK